MPTNSSTAFCRWTPTTGTSIPILAGQITHRPGITPSVAQLRIAVTSPTDVPSRTGTLIFGDGVNGTVAFQTCKADEINVEWARDGYEASMRVSDRRWKWAGLKQLPGTLYEHWNIRDMNGTIIETGYTKSTAYGLGTLLLNYMGETYAGTDIDLPSTDLPENCPSVDWSRVAPAQALEDLCAMYGRTVSLGLSDNKVHVWRTGEAGSEPASAANRCRRQDSVDNYPKPQYIDIIGSPQRIEANFSLLGVALDDDGRVLPYSSISYRPGGKYGGAGGTNWPDVRYPGGTFMIAPTMTRILAGWYGSDAGSRDPGTMGPYYAERCNRTWNRWYKLPDTVSVLPSPFDSDTIVRAIYMHGMKAETNNVMQNSDSQRKFEPAYIQGKYTTLRALDQGVDDLEDFDDEPAAQKANKRVRDVKFTLDTRNGLVIFAEPVFGVGATGTYYEPEITLRACFEYLPSVYTGTGPYGTDYDAGYRYSEYHPDFQFFYDAGSQGSATNYDEMVALARSYADEAGTRFLDRAGTSFSESFGGIHAYETDGQIREVSWSASKDQPPLTVISWNCHHSYAPEASLRQAQARQSMALQRKINEIKDYYRDREKKAVEEVD